MKELFDRIVQEQFPENQFYKEEFEKFQIVLHHTASGPSANGDINWWKSNPEKVATCVIVARDGVIHQLFSSKYWGHHLGIKSAFINSQGTSKTNTYLNQRSIGIEIDSWGQLTLKDGKYYSYTGAEVLKENVVVYENEFRGFKYYEKYTDEQIKSVRLLLIYWNQIYKIPLTFNEYIFNVSKNALNGVSGIWSHVSYRSDKFDCHPQIELVQMLKSL